MRLIPAMFAALLALPTNSSADEARTGAWIVANPDGGMVTLKAYAALEDGEGGSYELSATKKGNAGSSTNRQAGQVRPADGEEPKPLSVSRISVEQGASLNVTLKVTSTSGRVYETAYLFTSD